jgi:phosphatidylserine/phosphatidylglycerophosphate/cardiolipin synthase-like enzyme
MKTIILFALIIQSAFALKAPEVISVNSLRELPEFYLISNSVRDGFIGLNTKIKLTGNISCNEKVQLQKRGFFKTRKSGRNHDFKIDKSIQFKFPRNISTCILKLKDLMGNEKSIKLVKDEVQFSFLKEYNQKIEECSYSKMNNLLDINNLFLTNKIPMLSCVSKAPEIEILYESKDSFLTKIETLLGTKPPLSFINNQNPYAKLDFSRAPKLKAIFLTTLLYRRDFSGTVLARLLKFHAKRGTLINIIATGYMHNEKDQSLLMELSRYSGNIRVQEYKYQSKNPIKFPTKYAVDYLRNMHMKMMVTLSEKETDNTIITGGRNVHDGFVFSEKPDFSKFPELNQFSEEESYAYWQDLEIKVRSSSVAKSIYSHLLKFWNREINSQKMQPIRKGNSVELIDSTEIIDSDGVTMRHFMSAPFADDRSLEKLYVDMIDKAHKSIQLSTPYLRPTKRIMKAFVRAIDRGVDVAIQTRINLEGDTQAWLYEETNKAAINSLFKKAKIYEWSKSSILHTKLIIIDNEMAFFGSVNLSRRSFIQDMEHGLMIRGEKEVQKLSNIFVDYNSQSRRITEKESRRFWASLVIALIPNQF